MPSLNMAVQRLKVAILPLDVPCSGPVTHSGEILTTGKSHGLVDTWDRNGPTCGPTPWQIYDDDDDDDDIEVFDDYDDTEVFISQ